MFQNETRFNSAHGLAMRKIIHDRLSCESMNIIDVDTWSNNKSTAHPKRSDVKVDTFTAIGKIFLTSSLLEIEQRFFDDTEEDTFAEFGK